MKQIEKILEELGFEFLYSSENGIFAKRKKAGLVIYFDIERKKGIYFVEKAESISGIIKTIKSEFKGCKAVIEYIKI